MTLGDGPADDRSVPALPITPVHVLTNDGKQVTIYALLDSASTTSLMSPKLMDKLNLSSQGDTSIRINTLHGKRQVNGKLVDIEIKSVTEAAFLPAFEITVLP